VAAWRWRTILASLAALGFFIFAGLCVAALPRTAQTGCHGAYTGATYSTSVWVTRTCSLWYSFPADTPSGQQRDPQYRLTAVEGWTIFGQPLGVASGAHRLIFFGALAGAIWFASFGFLSVAIAIPVSGRVRAPVRESPQV
jgi:hypothetical protein